MEKLWGFYQDGLYILRVLGKIRWNLGWYDDNSKKNTLFDNYSWQ
jgi:hypothetical protein